MKKSFGRFYLVIMVAAAALMVFGMGAPAKAEICGEPTVVTLFAGQTIDAGTVTVSNDDQGNLYVTFSATDPWLLSETHLHVAGTKEGIPQTKSGNPKVGNFEYQNSYDPPVSEDTYVISGADALLVDGTLVIAAHAVVVQVDGDGNIIESETGWGDGNPFVDKGSWATYIVYTWQDCNGGGGGGESGTQTAFAFGGNYAECFLNLDLDGDGKNEFNRWGWTNGPLMEGSYSFDIYAGAAQCDLSKGTLVGTLNVVYQSGTAVVTFATSGNDPSTGLPYTMVETHLYVGSDILAKNNGDYTVAPGQYPTIHGELANVTSDSYTISGLSGEIYVVAHATVAGFPL